MLNLDISHLKNKKKNVKDIDEKILKEIVENSFYFKDVIIKLGFSHKGSKTRKKIQKLITDYNIDTTHFKYSYPKKLEEYLIDGKKLTNNSIIKEKLIKKGLLENKSPQCMLYTAMSRSTKKKNVVKSNLRANKFLGGQILQITALRGARASN